MIWQIEDICDHYLDSDAEDNNSEYKLNMFKIDKEINMATLYVNGSCRLKVNREKTMHNNVHVWARAESLLSTVPHLFQRLIHPSYNSRFLHPDRSITV